MTIIHQLMRANCFLILFLTVSVASLTAARLEPSDYLIDAPDVSKFHGRSALTLFDDYLSRHAALGVRMLDPEVTVGSKRSKRGRPGRRDEAWGYYDQCYGSSEVMRHLIAVQIKAMAELEAIESLDDVFNVHYGIGSKFHKDKGTIGVTTQVVIGFRVYCFRQGHDEN